MFTLWKKNQNGKFMFRLTIVLIAFFTFASFADEPQVSQILDDFHRAASEADGQTYFSLLHENAVFLGTDASERWSKAEFRGFAEPYFSKGKGWTYNKTQRHILISKDGNTAWFDEMLINKSYGSCRGTGVLTKTEQGWKIIQYNLSIPIPNGIAKDIVKQIKDF